MEYLVKQQRNFKFTYFLVRFQIFHQFFNVWI